MHTGQRLGRSAGDSPPQFQRQMSQQNPLDIEDNYRSPGQSMDGSGATVFSSGATVSSSSVSVSSSGATVSGRGEVDLSDNLVEESPYPPIERESQEPLSSEPVQGEVLYDMHTLYLPGCRRYWVSVPWVYFPLQEFASCFLHGTFVTSFLLGLLGSEHMISTYPLYTCS